MVDMDRPPWDRQGMCPLCGERTAPTTHHVQYECPVAAEMAEGTSVTTMEILDLPTTPERFKAQMSLVEHYSRAWTAARGPKVSRPRGEDARQNTKEARIRR